jgi:hypothetical protein
MKKQTLLLIGLGVVLIAMAKKKEKPKSNIIINEFEPSNSGGFKNGFPLTDAVNLFSSIFKKKPGLTIPKKSPLTGSSFLNKKKPMTLNFGL